MFEIFEVNENKYGYSEVLHRYYANDLIFSIFDKDQAFFTFLENAKNNELDTNFKFSLTIFYDFFKKREKRKCKKHWNLNKNKNVTLVSSISIICIFLSHE